MTDRPQADRSRKLASKRASPALDHRMLLYTVAAGAALAATPAISAEVVFTPSSAILSGTSGSFAIDLDNDGSADVQLSLTSIFSRSGYGKVTALVASGNQGEWTSTSKPQC